MNKRKLITALLFGLTSIVLGAFGAHGLRPYLEMSVMESFKTGINYQQFMSLYLMVLAFEEYKLNDRFRKSIFYFASFGTVLFSGSIYFLSVNKGVWGMELPAVVPLLTPIGGILIILSWTLLLVNLLKTDNK